MKHDTVYWLRGRSSNSARRTFLFSPSRSDQHTHSPVNWLPVVKPQSKAVEAWSSLHFSIYIFVVNFKMLFEFTDVWLTVEGWRLILWGEKNAEQTVLTGSYDNRPTDEQSNSQPPQYKAGVLHRDYLRIVSSWSSLLVVLHFIMARLVTVAYHPNQMTKYVDAHLNTHSTLTYFMYRTHTLSVDCDSPPASSLSVSRSKEEVSSTDIPMSKLTATESVNIRR